MKYTIGVFDSGIGGLNILNKIKKELPNENILYYGDTKNNPYGEKSDKELLELTKNIVDYLKNKGCKIIVIACNTATTRCIKELKKLYPDLIFIGTIPAIKVAYDNNSKNTLVLGTKATITSQTVKKLTTKYKHPNQYIYLQACDGLANAIEINNQKLINELLDKYLIPYQDKNIDTIILGCTHYPNIKNLILEYFPKVNIYDSSKYVAKKVKNKLKQIT